MSQVTGRQNKVFQEKTARPKYILSDNFQVLFFYLDVKSLMANTALVALTSR